MVEVIGLLVGDEFGVVFDDLVEYCCVWLFGCVVVGEVVF